MKTKMQLLRTPDEMLKAYLIYDSRGPQIGESIINPYSYMTETNNKLAILFYNFKKKPSPIRVFLTYSWFDAYKLTFTKDCKSFYTSISTKKNTLGGWLISAQEMLAFEEVDFSKIKGDQNEIFCIFSDNISSADINRKNRK